MYAAVAIWCILLLLSLLISPDSRTDSVHDLTVFINEFFILRTGSGGINIQEHHTEGCVKLHTGR